MPESSAREPGTQILSGYDPCREAVSGNYWFDREAAAKAAEFFPSCLRHIEGSTAGTPFVLQPWQDNFIRMLFGWMKKDSMGRVVRRYREVFLLIPRKNGKTPLAAGIGLYTFFCDQEPGAQVFCAAADTEQAALLFRHARGMVESEPELDSRASIFRGTGHRSIVLKNDPGSFFKVLSSDANTKHGGNTHMVMIDELHAQKDRDLVDVLETSMSSATRKHPLMVNITTADFDRISICNEKHDYARKVRDGHIDDGSFLPVLYEVLPTEDWTHPDVWARANPNLDISVSRDYMESKCKKAQESPLYENTFKRLHLNMRTAQDVVMLAMESWDSCPDIPPTEGELRDGVCFSGLDLASTTDLAALVFYWPKFKFAKAWFWLPGDAIEEREKRDKVPYLAWKKAGLIEFTPGNVIDYDYIIKRVVGAKEKYPKLSSVGYDPWNARQITVALQEKHGVNMIEYKQSLVTLNEPTKELIRMVKRKELNTGGNPVFRWMASNVAGYADSSGNVRPDKKKSTNKIDGIVALIMAIGLSISDRGTRSSVYEKEGAGLIFLDGSDDLQDNELPDHEAGEGDLADDDLWD